jgi:hypothetical protein
LYIVTQQQANLVSTLVAVIDKIDANVVQIGAQWVVEAKNLETGAITTLEHVGHALDMLSQVFKKTPAPATTAPDNATAN